MNESGKSMGKQGGLSCTLQKLLKNFKLSKRDIASLSKILTNLKDLEEIDVVLVAKKTNINESLLKQLRDAASFLRLPNLNFGVASELAKLGWSLDVLAKEDPIKLYELLEKTNLARRHHISLELLTSWCLSCERIVVSHHPPELGDPRIPKKMEPYKKHMYVIPSETSWEDLVGQFYGVKDKKAPHIVDKLSVINNSTIEKPIKAGERIVLPEFPDAKPEKLDSDSAQEKLVDFSKILKKETAQELINAGFLSLSSLRYINPIIDAHNLKISEKHLICIQTQAVLSSINGVSPEVAAYLAHNETFPDISAIAAANSEQIKHELDSAKYLGYIPYKTVTEINAIIDWLAVLQVFVGTIDLGTPPEESLCEPFHIPINNLENAYSYRHYPRGKRSDVLWQEYDKKQNYLDLALEIIAAGDQDTERAYQLVKQVKDSFQLKNNDLENYGIPSITSLLTVKNYLVENTATVRMLALMAEGHEMFHRREYGLALNAYNRMESMFPLPEAEELDSTDFSLILGREVNSSVDWSALWRNNPDTGTPLFSGDYMDIDQYYQDRSAGHNPIDHQPLDSNLLLERILHVDFFDYDRMMITPRFLAIQEGFRKYYYYIYNFILPLCKGDTYLELGNYCEALNHYLSVYYRSDFTEPLSDANAENEVRNTVGMDAYLLPTPFDTSSVRRYYTQYLHNVEKELVTLKVAEAMYRWGQFHYKRDENELAKSRYAQVLRILFSGWKEFRFDMFENFDDLISKIKTLNFNPRALVISNSGHSQLIKIKNKRNYLNYADTYVPVWTYPFLLNASRYLTEHAKQLERDSLQFLSSAEAELGNLKLMAQTVATAQSQLAVESRRIDEALASVTIAEAGVDLANQRMENAQSRIEELDNFYPARQTLGIVGGGMGGAGLGWGGALLGGLTSYFSGALEYQAQRNELLRQEMEIEKANEISNAEVNRSQISLSIARLQRNIAAMQLNFAELNLAFAQAKTLNADFWFEASKKLEEFAHDYLERAIEVAFLAEQAFEFMEERRIDRIKFDYIDTEGRFAADALLNDIDSIEYERIVSLRTKRMPIRHIISLRQRDFVAFEMFKRTGVIMFELPINEIDFVHPGTYHQRISRVEVEVRALVGPSGIRGTLTKSGLSYLRFRYGMDKFANVQDNIISDWVRYTPSEFRLAPVLNQEETLVISSYDIRKDSTILRPDPGEELRVFEGSGVGSFWTLKISPCNNSFDLNTVSDVNIIIYFNALFDRQLDTDINLERRKLISLGEFVTQKSKGYSFREAFPDQFYHIHNPKTPKAQNLRRRIVTFRLSQNDFPPNQINRTINGLVLSFVGENSLLSIKAYICSKVRSSDLDEAVSNPTAISWFPNTIESYEYLPEYPNLLVTGAFTQVPEDLWALRIDPENNPDLSMPGTYEVDADDNIVFDNDGNPIPDPGGKPIFDENKIANIKDVWLILKYSYELSGECGDPIVFWAHFSRHFIKSHIYKNRPAPTIGAMELAVANAQEFPNAGIIFIGNISDNQEMIRYSSITEMDHIIAGEEMHYWILSLDSPLSDNRAKGESVYLINSMYITTSEPPSVQPATWMTHNWNGSSRWQWDENNLILTQIEDATTSVFTPVTEFAWRDVKIDISIFLSNVVDSEIGIAFRYQPPGSLNEGNCYLIRLNALPGNEVEAHLEKRINGILTPVEPQISLQLGKNMYHQMQIRTMANNMEIAINSNLIFRATNNDIASGSIGLYSSGFGGAAFADLVISDSTNRY